jgi:hypothetical protein
MSFNAQSQKTLRDLQEKVLRTDKKAEEYDQRSLFELFTALAVV